MESTQRAIALGIVAPLAAAMVFFWLAWRRADAAVTARHVATALALPTLFALAWAFGIERPAFPPKSGADWLLPITATAGIVAVFECLFRVRFAGTPVWVCRALLLLGGAWLMSRNRLANGWPVAEASGFIAGAAAAGLGAWWSLARIGRETGATSPLIIVIAVTFSSVTAVLTGHISAALAPAVLCAVVGPAMLVALTRPALSLGPGVGFGAAFLAGNWFVTSVLGETPWLCNAFAALAVVLAGVTAGHRFTGWRGTLVRVVLVATPGIAGVVWALLNQPGPGEY